MFLHMPFYESMVQFPNPGVLRCKICRKKGVVFLLYNNRRASLSKQIMVQEANRHFGEFLRGRTGCILPSVYDLAVNNQKLAVDLASEVYKVFCNRSLIKESDWNDKYYTLVAYGFLMCDLAFIYNPDTEKFELHTSSATMIRNLASKGSIEAPTAKDAPEVAVQKALSALSEDKKILTSLKKDNTVQTVRLEPSRYGNTLKFKVVVPRSQIDITKSVVIPFTCYIEVIKKLQELFSRGLIRVTMNGGEKVRAVTLNSEVLSKVYSKDRINQLYGYVPNAYMRSFYVPSVGASTYSIGVTNIHPEAIDKLEIIRLSDVDLSDVNLDLTMVKPFFMKKIESLNLQQLNTVIRNLGVSVTDTSLTRTKLGCIVILEKWIYKSQDPGAYESNIYAFMKDSPFFDLDEFRAMPNIYGNIYEAEDIPTSISNLKALLNTGVFRITTVRRAGTMSTHIVTNNNKELKRVLGDDYFITYESEGVRLEYAKSYIVSVARKSGVNAEMPNPDKIFKDLEKFDIYIPYSLKPNMYTYEDVWNYLKECKQHIDDTSKTVVSQSHLVLARNCQAYYDVDERKAYDYYKNIDVNNIVSVTRLSYAEGYTGNN